MWFLVKETMRGKMGTGLRGAKKAPGGESLWGEGEEKPYSQDYAESVEDNKDLLERGRCAGGHVVSK